MKDSKFWLQIIIPTVVSILFGGFGLFLLSQFKERLPEWFYNALVAVIYVVFVAILLFFLILIIRAAFGDWLVEFTRLKRKKRRQRKIVRLTTEWCGKWREFGLLLLDVCKHNWKPTEKQEEDFARLRTWLTINRAEFLSVWHSFNNHRRNMAHEHYGSSSRLDYKVFFENHDDPFSYFYQPPSIDQLKNILQYRDNETPTVLLRLKERLDECVEWVNREE
ncbi:hypothetical protein ACFLWZ_04525 [Chloroflexota bacterium]